MPIASLLTTKVCLRPKAYLQNPQIGTKPSHTFHSRNSDLRTTACSITIAVSLNLPNRQINFRPPCRLISIALPLLTTEIVVWSKHSLSEKLLFHKKLPQRPKGASMLTSFHAILAVCTHTTVHRPMVFLLLRAHVSPSSTVVRASAPWTVAQLPTASSNTVCTVLQPSLRWHS